jgi:hypothetical protein
MPAHSTCDGFWHGTRLHASSRFARISDLLYDWQPLARDVEAPAARDLRDRLNERLHRANPLITA